MIQDIKRDEARKTVYKGQERIVDSIRLEFKLDGCKEAHFSRWMTFSYSEKAHLYNMFLVPLVEGITPFCDFDIEQLKGAKVKIMWKDIPYTDKQSKKKTYQAVDVVRPAGEKIKITDVIPPVDEEAREVEAGEHEEFNPLD